MNSKRVLEESLAEFWWIFLVDESAVRADVRVAASGNRVEDSFAFFDNVLACIGVVIDDSVALVADLVIAEFVDCSCFCVSVSSCELDD